MMIYTFNREQFTEVYQARGREVLDFTFHQDGKMSALHMAARFGLEQIVKDLISFGADVNAKDEKGRLPIHHGCRHILMEVSDCNAQDRDGNTPLHLAMIGLGNLPSDKSYQLVEALMQKTNFLPNRKQQYPIDLFRFHFWKNENSLNWKDVELGKEFDRKIFTFKAEKTELSLLIAKLDYYVSHYFFVEENGVFVASSLSRHDSDETVYRRQVQMANEYPIHLKNKLSIIKKRVQEAYEAFLAASDGKIEMLFPATLIKLKK